MAETTRQTAATKERVTAASSIEAEIRRNARPFLSPEERALKAAEKAALDIRLAAARAHDAAAEQMARAEDYDDKADKAQKEVERLQQAVEKAKRQAEKQAQRTNGG